MITVVVDVDATKFIAVSEASKEALKTATLLRSLTINALIRGEKGVGKKTLASYILPSAPIVNARKYEELLSLLHSEREIIVVGLENVANIKVVLEKAMQHHVRIVATADENYTHKLLEEFFIIDFTIPPFSQREKDILPLVERFLSEFELLMGKQIRFDFESFEADLSENAYSLKKQILLAFIFEEMGEKEMMQLMYDFLYEKLGSNNDYKNFLYLYEVPLIKAGLKRFKSQLQLAEKLGLNRNTLRKKISENKEYLK